MSDVETPPVLQTTGDALYALMNEQATEQDVQGTTVLVWRGKIVKTCESVGIPYGSYRKTILALESIGAIKLVQRGTRGAPSVIALLQAPTPELWASYDGSRGEKHLTEAAAHAKILADVQRITDELGGVNLREALINIEKRLSALEHQAKSSKT